MTSEKFFEIKLRHRIRPIRGKIVGAIATTAEDGDRPDFLSVLWRRKVISRKLKVHHRLEIINIPLGEIVFVQNLNALQDLGRIGAIDEKTHNIKVKGKEKKTDIDDKSEGMFV
jgi:hypothetical protein